MNADINKRLMDELNDLHLATDQVRHVVLAIGNQEIACDEKKVEALASVAAGVLASSCERLDALITVVHEAGQDGGTR